MRIRPLRPVKIVMQCPNCKTRLGPQPIVRHEPDGHEYVEFELPRKCRKCGSKLERRVQK